MRVSTKQRYQAGKLTDVRPRQRGRGASLCMLLLALFSLSACSSAMETGKSVLFAVGVTGSEQREIQTRYIAPVGMEFEEALESIGLGDDTVMEISELSDFAKQMFASGSSFTAARKAPRRKMASRHRRGFRDSVDGFLSGLSEVFPSSESDSPAGFERF